MQFNEQCNNSITYVGLCKNDQTCTSKGLCEQKMKRDVTGMLIQNFHLSREEKCLQKCDESPIHDFLYRAPGCGSGQEYHGRSILFWRIDRRGRKTRKSMMRNAD